MSVQFQILATFMGKPSAVHGSACTVKHVVEFGSEFFIVELGPDDDIRQNPVPVSVEPLVREGANTLPGSKLSEELHYALSRVSALRRV